MGSIIGPSATYMKYSTHLVKALADYRTNRVRGTETEREKRGRSGLREGKSKRERRWWYYGEEEQLKLRKWGLEEGLFLVLSLWIRDKDMEKKKGKPRIKVSGVEISRKDKYSLISQLHARAYTLHIILSCWFTYVYFFSLACVMCWTWA